MQILLLGATGLLGHNVLLRLLEGGYDVVALVRHRDGLRLPQALLSDARLHIVEGAYSTDTLRDAARPCQAIINCAGTTDMSLLRYSDYVPINVTLCEQVIQVMEELDIRTLVHVSSANTIGYGNTQHPATEEADMEAPFTRSYYAQSKRAAEQMLAWTAMEHPDWHLICLNPGFMVGPYDTKPSSGKLLLAAYGRKMMAIPSGGKAFVDVRDVAAAAVSALKKGHSGSRYLLAGQSLTLQQFYALQAQICGYKQRQVGVSDFLLKLLGRVGDLMRFCGCRTQLATRNVRQLMVTEYYDCSAAVRDLDFAASDLEGAIRAFFAWREEHCVTDS